MDEEEPTSKNSTFEKSKISHIKTEQDQSEGQSQDSQTHYSLKNEWSLFWDAIKTNHSRPDFEEDFEEVKSELPILSADQIKEMAKQLSQSRKKINQKIESINKEIELNTAKLDTLRLVGSSDEVTIARIHELNDLGQKLSQELFDLDEKIRLARKLAPIKTV